MNNKINNKKITTFLEQLRKGDYAFHSNFIEMTDDEVGALIERLKEEKGNIKLSAGFLNSLYHGSYALHPLPNTSNQELDLKRELFDMVVAYIYPEIITKEFIEDCDVTKLKSIIRIQSAMTRDITHYSMSYNQSKRNQEEEYNNNNKEELTGMLTGSYFVNVNFCFKSDNGKEVENIDILGEELLELG